MSGFNGGGLIADYIIDYMRRPLMGYFSQREGDDYRTPVGSIYGPKAMIINEYAGSGGDALPWMFRHAEYRPARRQANMGRGWWASRLPAPDGRRQRDRAQHGLLEPQWNVGRGESRRRAGCRGGVRPATSARGTRPTVGTRRRIGHGRAQENPLPTHTRPAYPDYHQADRKAAQVSRP